MVKPEFQEIFIKLKELLMPYSKELDVRRNDEKVYEVFGNKTVETNVSGEEKVDGVYFASAKIQKSFVGFYFFPIYTHPENFKHLSKPLKALLKGQTSFHFKKYDEEIFAELKEIIKEGEMLYTNLQYIAIQEK